MIKIDFVAGAHGHFLEYVANVYIMQTLPSNTSIFTDAGVSHRADAAYLHNKIIKCGHFSYENLPFDDTDRVIRIVCGVGNDTSHFIINTNIIYRAGDLGFATHMEGIPQSTRDNSVLYRNAWYSKFNEYNKYGYVHDFIFPIIPNECFEFDFNAFYCFTKFCKELNKLAFFLNQAFFPNDSLYVLWHEFITNNQGLKSFNKCNKIIENIFSNKTSSIDCTIIEQGWINYNISKICRLYDGSLFDNENYPIDTKLVYNEIQNHLNVIRYE